MQQKGSVSLIISLVVLLAGLSGGFYVYTQKLNSDSLKKAIKNPELTLPGPSPLLSPSPSPSPSQSSIVSLQPQNDEYIYSLEELKGIISNNSKDECVEAIRMIVHAFPGYKYEKLTGVMRDGNIYDEKANVLISLTGEGLEGAQALKDFSEDIRKDTYTFEMHYDSTEDSCKISSGNIFNWLFPAKADEEAKTLVKKDPIVQEFFNKYTNPGLSYVDWLEIGRSEYTNNRESLKYIDDKNSVFVMMHLSGMAGDEQKLARRQVFIDLKTRRVILSPEVVGPVLQPQ